MALAAGDPDVVDTGGNVADRDHEDYHWDPDVDEGGGAEQR